MLMWYLFHSVVKSILSLICLQQPLNELQTSKLSPNVGLHS